MYSERFAILSLCRFLVSFSISLLVTAFVRLPRDLVFEFEVSGDSEVRRGGILCFFLEREMKLILFMHIYV
jgi:hypothetical protein